MNPYITRFLSQGQKRPWLWETVVTKTRDGRPVVVRVRKTDDNRHDDRKWLKLGADHA